jgi:hypothetical protein
MALVGDRERERTADFLRRHYVEGRLSVEELGNRVGVALGARSDGELRAARSDLPGQWRTDDWGVLSGLARRGVRLATLVLLVGVWWMVSLALAIAFVVTLAVSGPSLAVGIGFPLAWVLATWALWRIWRRGRSARAR